MRAADRLRDQPNTPDRRTVDSINCSEREANRSLLVPHHQGRAALGAGERSGPRHGRSASDRRCTKRRTERSQSRHHEFADADYEKDCRVSQQIWGDSFDHFIQRRSVGGSGIGQSICEPSGRQQRQGGSVTGKSGDGRGSQGERTFGPAAGRHAWWNIPGTASCGAVVVVLMVFVLCLLALQRYVRIG